METPHQSLMMKFLTPECRARLASVRTSRGFSLTDIIKSGIENPDSSIGLYAPDAESYEAFAPLFHGVIRVYHGYGEGERHHRDLDPRHLNVGILDSSGERIVSTRIRVGRNLKGFPLAPGIGRRERLDVERRIVDALSTLTGDLAGAYYPLTGMPEETRRALVADHFLFKQGDRFLESAGANRDWPEGRGIFHSADKKFLVWVNEEDQLRIISMETGGNLGSVFGRLSRAIVTLERTLDFAYSDRFGYLTSCPSNLGTAMRASFHMRLPTVSAQPEFKETAARLGLSVRGVHGEHSESEGGVFDISNKRRLGISEVEAVNMVYAGAKTLLELDTKRAL